MKSIYKCSVLPEIKMFWKTVNTIADGKESNRLSNKNVDGLARHEILKLFMKHRQTNILSDKRITKNKKVKHRRKYIGNVVAK